MTIDSSDLYDQLHENTGRGNIDLTNRPRVVNPDGSISTVRSMSFNFDGKEVLLPTISDEGKNLSPEEAKEQFRRTGKHLGIFNSPEEATQYAQKLHEQQALTLSQNQGDEESNKIYNQIKISPLQEMPDTSSGEILTRGALRTGARIGEIGINAIDQLRELVEPKLSLSEKEQFKKHLNALSFTDRPVNITEKSLLERAKGAEKAIAGEYLEPHTPGEKDWDEFVTEAAPFVLLGGPETTALGRTLRGAGASLSGLLAKKYTKYSGGSESAQDTAKNATQFVASIYNPGGAMRDAGARYRRSEALLPETATGDARALQHEMQVLATRMRSGTIAPSERAILEESEAILGKIHNGEMTYREAIDSIRSGNEKFQAFLYSTPDRAAQARARHLYRRIHGHLEDFVDQADQHFPEAIRELRTANEMFGTVLQSQRASAFMRKVLLDHPMESVMASIFGLEKLGGKGLVKTGVAGAAAYPIYKGIQVAYRVMRSPHLRNYYFRALRQASAQNGPALLKTLNGMRGKMEDDTELMKFLKQRKIAEEYAGSPA